MNKRERIAQMKKAFKMSGLTQLNASIEIGISLPTFLKVLKEGLLIKNIEKRGAVDRWIRTMEEK